MIFLKIILLIAFIAVFIQDYKERQVYWFLFPIIGILGGILFYQNTLSELFLVAIQINLLFLVALVFIIYIYAKIKLKTKLLNTLGLGDLFLFLAISVSFSTLSFIILFISALIFSLVLHLIINKHQKTLSVPLAGYMSLFFLTSYLCYWSKIIDNVYSL